MKETKGEVAMRKVRLIEDLIESYSTGIVPSDEQKAEARDLGIDLEELEACYENPNY